MNTQLSTLLQDIVELSANDDCECTGITLDSRRLRSGEIFVATTTDLSYITQAIDKGASAILLVANSSIDIATSVPIILIAQQHLATIAQRFYQHPSADLHVVGITGTNGKTSCSHFIAQALARHHQSCGVIGTIGHGIYPELSEVNLTTPDIFSLQAWLAYFRQQQVSIACVEASSHGLVQQRLAGITFEIAVFTNITRDHLDYHGDMSSYLAAKQQLFAWPGLQAAVINGDDEFGRELIATYGKQYPIIAYTQQGQQFAQARMLMASEVCLDQQGIHAKIESPWGSGQLHSRLLGRFNLSNLLASLACLCQLDIDFNQALIALAEIKEIAGRMQKFSAPGRPTVVVDFAHTPDALQQVLMALREHCQAKLICVFGCGGDRDRGKRPLMAGVVEQYADDWIITDDNPRSEVPEKIVADMVQGLSTTPHIIHDRATAIRMAIHRAEMNDVVLIAGKGHEAYQQVGDQRLPFSDIEQVQQCLQDEWVGEE